MSIPWPGSAAPHAGSREGSFPLPGLGTGSATGTGSVRWAGMGFGDLQVGCAPWVPRSPITRPPAQASPKVPLLLQCWAGWDCPLLCHRVPHCSSASSSLAGWEADGMEPG